MPSFAAASKRSRPLLGTFVRIELRGPSAQTLRAATSHAFSLIEKTEELMSFHRRSSDLGRLNDAPPGTWVKVHGWTMTVLRASNRLFDLSKGSFDIRCGSALARWGLLPAQGPALPRTGTVKGPPVEMKGGRARRPGPGLLDLGGIAKGFAVDRAADYLRRQGLAGSVNAGGDLRHWGVPGSVEIRGGSWSRSLTMKAGALASSSVIARRVPGRRGRISAHVQVGSGRALTRPVTASVFSRSCLYADALTKVALMAPPTVSRNCLKDLRAQALIFGAQGRLLRSLP